MLRINEDTFQKEVIESEIPVMVDFYATWCTPCKMIVPMLITLSNEAKGKYKICSMNIDDGMEIVNKLGIKSVPAFVFWKNGIEVDRIQSVQSKQIFVNILNKLTK